MHRKLNMEELGRMSPEEFRQSNKRPVALVLDQVRSGVNVGSLFRSADAFSVECIYCCGYTPTPPHREILKTALGATETVAWQYVENTIDVIHLLRSKGYTIWSLEQATNSVDLHDLSLTEGPLAVVLGNEVTGVEQSVIDASDLCVEIAQHGSKHSLNVAVCGGIVLFHLDRLFAGK